jgi:UDP-N-acetylmuramoylalanine--D-glutamate ligase
MVVKNPGVRTDSPFLKAAKRIETDISLFLAASPARLLAVTGSKGKSSTASALHWVLTEARKRGLLQGKAYLGGNITVSPLTFLDELCAEDDVVLELSSWQLGDLRGKVAHDNVALLKPRVAVLTAILPDHQNYYGSMESYVADKRVIYQGQDSDDVTIATDDVWGQSFLRETRGRTLVYGDAMMAEGSEGGWMGKVSDTSEGKTTPEKVSDTSEGKTAPEKVSDTGAGKTAPEKVSDTSTAGFARLTPDAPSLEVVPAKLLVPGPHQKKNLLASALALLDIGLPPDFIRDTLAVFPGIEHRLEFFHEANGVRFYNDTAATIPEAAVAALAAFDAPVVLVTGGTDKNLDYSPLVKAAGKAKALILLAGTGSDKLCTLLQSENLFYHGPFTSLDAAIKTALEVARSGDAVVLSPGSASFGMFQNEFDRGRQWKEGVKRFTTS